MGFRICPPPLVGLAGMWRQGMGRFPGIGSLSWRQRIFLGCWSAEYSRPVAAGPVQLSLPWVKPNQCCLYPDLRGPAPKTQENSRGPSAEMENVSWTAAASSPAAWEAFWVQPFSGRLKNAPLLAGAPVMHRRAGPLVFQGLLCPGGQTIIYKNWARPHCAHVTVAGGLHKG